MGNTHIISLAGIKGVNYYQPIYGLFLLTSCKFPNIPLCFDTLEYARHEFILPADRYVLNTNADLTLKKGVRDTPMFKMFSNSSLYVWLPKGDAAEVSIMWNKKGWHWTLPQLPTVHNCWGKNTRNEKSMSNCKEY